MTDPEPPAPGDPTPDATPSMTIAIDAGPLYGHRTGVGIAAQGMIDALGRDDRVILAPYLVSGRSTPRPGHRKLPVPGIVASHLWSRGDHPRADRWLSSVDVVHGTNYVVPPTRMPTVVSVYDCWFLANPAAATPLVRRAGHMLRRAVARGAWVHTAADAIAEQARSLLATERVTTVPLGPPPPPPPLSALDRPAVADRISGRPFVVAIGTEERRKDLPLLIDAFGLTGLDEHLLVLAGSPGDASTEIEGRIGRLPAEGRDRVLRLGAVDDNTKHWLVRQAAVVAYPSLDEGFGFPVLDAQAAGTPVVTRAVGAIPEVAGAGARLVAERDAAEVADALVAVCTDGATRLGLIEAGHRNLGRFSWDETAAGLHRMYRRAIGAHS